MRSKGHRSGGISATIVLVLATVLLVGRMRINLTRPPASVVASSRSALSLSAVR